MQKLFKAVEIHVWRVAVFDYTERGGRKQDVGGDELFGGGESGAILAL
jgi:hypothetical protein